MPLAWYYFINLKIDQQKGDILEFPMYLYVNII